MSVVWKELRSVYQVDRLDLGDLERGDVLAILFPVSESAIHSLNLKENRKNVFTLSTLSDPKFPPSPSHSEDEGSCFEAKSYFAPKNREEKPGGSHRVIVLRHKPDQCTFTFGTGANHYVNLQHKGPCERYCWINASHCQFIPHTDDDSLTLYNTSTSILIAKRLTTPQDVVSIVQHEEAILRHGIWLLTLGEGMEFVIKIPPRPIDQFTRGWELIASCSNMVSSVTVKKGAKNSKSSKSCVVKKKGPPSQDATQQAGPIKISQHELIGKTRTTEVFKATRNGRVVAAKVCRQAYWAEAAKDWANEANILRMLHGCVRLLPEIVQRSSSDAI